MAKIVLYRNKCIGCGTCQEQQPSIWRMSKKDGKASLLKAEVKNGLYVLEVSEAAKEETKTMAKNCPVSCIKTS
jgi:ferredoxin